MPKKGGRRKKARTHTESEVEGGGAVGADVPKSDVPRSIVAKAGKVSPHVGSLVKDLRKMMGPYTATNLKERGYNRVKDYTAVASQLGISHILAVTETKSNIVLRVARFQNGPTLHFRIPQYSLAKHVRSMQRRPFDSSSAYLTPPLVVLNNFSQAEDSHLQLMRVTLQHMFPSINVNTVRLNECRRVVLFHYLKEDSTVEMRHYAIRASPVGITRSVKKVITSKIPNLGNLQDISEFIQGASAAGGLSDSEMEDDPASRVELPERYVGAGNAQSQQSAMRLMELGPRLTMELFKVEKGLCEGDVLYHKFEQKTAAEAAATKAKVEAARNLKLQRRAQQEENVRRKRDLAEVKKAEREERKKRRLEGGGAAEDSEESGEEDSDEEQEDYGSSISGVEGDDLDDQSNDDEEDDEY